MKYRKLAACLAALLLTGCASKDTAPARRPEPQESREETAEIQATDPTETEYIRQTVSFCVGYTTKQFESGSETAFTFDYDDYGRCTKRKKVVDGVVMYDYAYAYLDDGMARTDEFDADGALLSSRTCPQEKLRIDITIGGYPREQHGVYTYNDDGYVIREENGPGNADYVREYSPDYSKMWETACPRGGGANYLCREAELDEFGNPLTEEFYNAAGETTLSKVYLYDEQGRISRVDVDTHNQSLPLVYPMLYAYDDDGNLIYFAADYYYGYETVYEYRQFDIWVPVAG